MNTLSSLDIVEQACTALTGAGEPITFTAISEHTGLSRATLYRNQQLRAVIDEHRTRHGEARTLSGLTGEIAHLRLALEAVAATVKRQDERLRRLERRNTQ
ncbi:MAG TPA: DUF6262 family protein [Pseudonocardiaceae bacterium]|jgi:hypothetical protein